MNTGLWKKIKDFTKVIDPSSWPAFFMFAVVLAAAGGLNYAEMSKIVSPIVAALIAMLFGIGVLAWHIVESRTDDNEDQEDIAQFTKWLNAGLDGVLLVVNLFRAEFDDRSYDITAFVIIGVSAASHVVAYLLWTQNDPRRLTRKELERGLSDVERRAGRADIAIKKTEREMMKRKWVEDESVRLRNQYRNTPSIDVESMIRQMKNTALKEFEGLQAQDLESTQARPAYAQTAGQSRTNVPMPSNATQTGGNAPGSHPSMPDPVKTVLGVVGGNKAGLEAWMKERDLVGPTETREALRSELGLNISNNQFGKAWARLFPTQAGSRSQ